MELEADEQRLGHDKADGLESFRGHHEGEAQPAHVDLPVGRHRRAHRNEHDGHYEAARRIFQSRHKQRQHRYDRRERLRRCACDSVHAHRKLRWFEVLWTQNSDLGCTDQLHALNQRQEFVQAIRRHGDSKKAGECTGKRSA